MSTYESEETHFPLVRVRLNLIDHISVVILEHLAQFPFH